MTYPMEFVNVLNTDFLGDDPAQTPEIVVNPEKPSDELQPLSDYIYYTITSNIRNEWPDWRTAKLDVMIGNVLQKNLKYDPKFPVLLISGSRSYVPNWLRFAVCDYVIDKKSKPIADDWTGDVILSNGSIIGLTGKRPSVIGASNVTDDELLMYLIGVAMYQVCDMRELEYVIQLFIMNIKWIRKHPLADILLGSIIMFILQAPRILLASSPQMGVRPLSKTGFVTALSEYLRMPGTSNVMCGQILADEQSLHWSELPTLEQGSFYAMEMHKKRLEDCLVPIPVGFIDNKLTVEWFMSTKNVE